MRRDRGPRCVQVHWHGAEKGSAPEWDEGRFLALTIDGPCNHAVYVAFNTRHTPALAELPDARPGRLWRLVADTGLRAPLDVMVVDDALSAPAAAEAAATAAEWTRVGAYPMLPWSCVILESVPEHELEATGGLDKWDGIASELPPPAAAPASGAAASDSGAGGDVTLTFGVALKEQGLLANGLPPPDPVNAGGAGAAAPPGAGRGGNEAATSSPPVAARATGGIDTELEALAKELLGPNVDVAALAPADRELLAENLALRKRLDGR